MLRVMVIESKQLELVPERYAETIMNSSASLSHWQTIEMSESDLQRYEDLRLELEELITSARFPNTPCPRHEGAFDCTPFCELCQGNQEIPRDN